MKAPSNLLPRPTKLLAILALSTVATISCRQASYEILKPGTNLGSSGIPNPFAAPSNPTPPATAGAPVPPTAHVEVAVNGTSVIVVNLNQPTMIRPSWDTLAPNWVGIDSCANPGIARADYSVGAEAKPSAVRGTGCDSLAVPYTFTHTGDIEIDMVVTSRDNLTAYASMILTVIDPATPTVANDGGFTIEANPMVAAPGQTITFTSDCGLHEATIITWDFGDGATATGAVVTHAYPAVGQEKVTAVCTGQDGKNLTSLITIDVVPTAPTLTPPTGWTPLATPTPAPVQSPGTTQQSPEQANQSVPGLSSGW